MCRNVTQVIMLKTILIVKLVIWIVTLVQKAVLLAHHVHQEDYFKMETVLTNAVMDSMNLILRIVIVVTKPVLLVQDLIVMTVIHALGHCCTKEDHVWSLVVKGTMNLIRQHAVIVTLAVLLVKVVQQHAHPAIQLT